MVILGIDPGIGRTGWGVVHSQAGRVTLLDFGCIETAANSTPADRLMAISAAVDRLVSRFIPVVAGVETLLFNTNSKTVMAVGQARGVVLVTLAKRKVALKELSPLQVKLAVTGYGRADKVQVQRMVKTLLGLERIPKPDDAADALAVCLAVAAVEPWQSLKEGKTSAILNS